MDPRLQRHRSTPTRGKVVDLLPLAEAHAADVVRLRNQQRAMHFMTSPKPLTVEDQRRWFADYLRRDDDLQWMIAAKDGALVGVTALYDIDLAAGSAEKGRLVSADEISLAAPYVLEAELLLLRLAFGELGLQTVSAAIRPDNDKVISAHARMGFRRDGSKHIRGTDYEVHRLRAERFDPTPMEAVVDHFRQRSQAARDLR